MILGASYPSLTACSTSGRKSSPDESRSWDDFRPKILHAAGKASDFYAPLFKAKVQKLLHPIEESNFRSIPLNLIEDFSTAMKLSLAIYSNIVDGIPLSTGNDDLPDCVAKYDHVTKTLWIISRGTHTADDVISDMSWLTSTEKIGHLDIPFGVVARCKKITPKLLDHLVILQIQKADVKKMIFIGHSLGGSVALGLYLSWHVDKEVARGGKVYNDRLETSVISIGAPLLISNPKSEFRVGNPPSKNEIPDNKKFSGVTGHARNVHNIVMGMDIVPRILGEHPLPNCISEATEAMGFGDLNQKLSSSNIHRGTYQPYGNFYSLREEDNVLDKGLINILNFGKDDNNANSRDKVPFLLGRVSDPKTFLSCFPDNVIDIAYSIHRDHRLIESTRAIDAALKHAKGF